MKRMLSVAVLSALGAGSMAVQAAEFADTAQVISATPIYDRVSAPRQECVNEPVTTYEDRRVRRDTPDAYRENRDYRVNSTERAAPSSREPLPSSVTRTRSGASTASRRSLARRHCWISCAS